jgi:hypothetical protein
MRKRFARLWKSSKQTVSSQTDRALEHSCAGRVVSALTFLVVIFCLGLWIAAFLLLRDRLFTETLSGNILTNLTCVTFFGGLGIAIIVGALAGNFLRRAFWKLLVNRAKRK